MRARPLTARHRPRGGANVVRACGVVLVLALAGCQGVPYRQLTASPCLAGEATYECQIERYHNVNVQ